MRIINCFEKLYKPNINYLLLYWIDEGGEIQTFLACNFTSAYVNLDFWNDFLHFCSILIFLAVAGHIRVCTVEMRKLFYTNDFFSRPSVLQLCLKDYHWTKWNEANHIGFLGTNIEPNGCIGLFRETNIESNRSRRENYWTKLTIWSNIFIQVHQAFSISCS